MTNSVLSETMTSLNQLARISSGGRALAAQLFTSHVLSSGFIVTSLLWGASLAAIIDRKLRIAGIYCAIAAVCSLFGVIHSSQPGAPLALPWKPSTFQQHEFASQLTPYWIASAYASVAVLLIAWQWWADRSAPMTARLETRNSKFESSPKQK
jgi:hypothetical protein